MFPDNFLYYIILVWRFEQFHNEPVDNEVQGI